MPESYYRTGQAAKQLGVSSYHIRRLCEAGEIAAEITEGQQWKIPAAEVARLKREGVPPVPTEIETEPESEDDEFPEGLYANPSERVIEAAEEVKVVQSQLQKRRLEREAEEVEDWFRDRQRRQAAEEATERQRKGAVQAEQQRRQWVQHWTQYALNSLPGNAPKETELDVHAAVQEVLQRIAAGQPDEITRRLIDAAVAKALRPWNRRQQIERALQAAMNHLPWHVGYNAEYAPLKQRAWDAAVAAVRKVREEASYSEMETAAVQAVQPMIREYEHQQACERALHWIFITGASYEEQEPAKEAVRKALAALPVGATEKQLQEAKQSALMPIEAAVARRKEAERIAREEQATRRAAEWKVDLELNHIARYLEQEYDFDGGYSERWREAERLRPLIREALIEELLENPEMSSQEIREAIQDHIDDEM